MRKLAFALFGLSPSLFCEGWGGNQEGGTRILSARSHAIVVGENEWSSVFDRAP